jgi:hypothetical protein
MRARVLASILTVSVAMVPLPLRAEEPPSAQSEVRERSRQAFRKGVAELRAQRWPEARAQFEEAYRLFPHPSILLNLGLTRLETGDPVLAEEDLVRFLGEDTGASADEVFGAREALAKARQSIGTLRVTASPPSARVSVDDVPISGVARLAAGPHVVLVEADGHASERQDVVVAARQEIEITVVLVPLDSAERGTGAIPARTALGWGAAGLSGVALLTSGVTALRARSLADDYANPGSSRFQSAETRSEGVTYRTAADVALGVAVIGGAAALVLLLTDIGKPAVASTGRRWQTPGVFQF